MVRRRHVGSRSVDRRSPRRLPRRRRTRPRLIRCRQPRRSRRRRRGRPARWRAAGSSPTPTARRPAPSPSATTAAKVGKRVEFDPGCAKQFPFIPEIAGWRLDDNDFLRLLDAQGNSVLEFSEVESGIFEAPKPGEGILFIQNPDRPRSGAARPPSRSPASGSSSAAPASGSAG